MTGSRTIVDPSVESLANVASTLAADYRTDRSDWQGSPFAWIIPHPPARQGAIGKRLISTWLETSGLSVTHCSGREADRIVNGRRVAMKFSMLWEEGLYRFQQIRDQRYDLLICLGVSPFDAHSWVFTKEFLMQGRGTLEGFRYQHRGNAGADTAWIHVDPRTPQQWLTLHGGTLDDALGAMPALLSR